MLVVIAIIAMLMAIGAPVLGRSRDCSRVCRCTAQLRTLAQFTAAFADEHADRMPRSQHSAASAGEMPWGYAFFESITGRAYAPGDAAWEAVFNGAYRCPSDARRDRWSYGYNVYFELDAEETGDRSWRRFSAVPRPAATVVLTELSDLTGADHAMAHFWSQYDAPPEVDGARHRGSVGAAFADGHARTQEFKAIYDVDHDVDRFNPETAR